MVYYRHLKYNHEKSNEPGENTTSDKPTFVDGVWIIFFVRTQNQLTYRAVVMTENLVEQEIIKGLLKNKAFLKFRPQSAGDYKKFNKN